MVDIEGSLALRLRLLLVQRLVSSDDTVARTLRYGTGMLPRHAKWSTRVVRMHLLPKSNE